MEQHTTLTTQIVIVGAGPTGLSLAAQLLRYNIRCVILEKNKETTGLSKAVAVQARTLEILDELGLAQQAISQGQVTTALNLFYKGKRKAHVNLSGLGKGMSAFPYALSLEQSKTEHLLANYLSEHGKTVLWGAALDSVQQDGTGVTVFYKTVDGQTHKIHADYLVGCDGASSLVRHQLGLPFNGDTVPKLFYVADVTLDSPVIHKNELYIFLIRKGFILFFPMEGSGHYRIVGILPEVKDEDQEIPFTDIERSIKEQILSPVAFKELRWFSTYRVHSRKADQFMKGRCFIAGDAAHIHTPAGGQGMNTGIQDAYNLAWKLAYVLKGEAGTAILNTYSAERVENAEHLLQTTDRMFDIMAGSTGFLNFIRLHLLPFLAGLISRSGLAKKKAFPLLSQTGIAYPHSALTIQSSIGKVRAGMRMPYFTFQEGTDIYSYLQQPCFKLLYFGIASPDNPLKDLRLTLSFYTFKEAPAWIFGSETAFYILLRPDNHICYIGKDKAACRRLAEILKAAPSFVPSS